MLARNRRKDTVTSEDLDELVHEMKAREAQIINNQGIKTQLDYLKRICGLRAKDIADWIGGER